MKRFRHEDIAAVPAGWRVRTITRGEHRVRVACHGPSAKGGGSCKLISILHPAKEGNPCGMRYLLPNPSELLIMGANPTFRRPNPHSLGQQIARMKDRGASPGQVGQMLSRATRNPQSPPNRYFVVEEATGILRAAQSTREGAEHYLTPGRILVGPMTPEEFRRQHSPRRVNAAGRNNPRRGELVSTSSTKEFAQEAAANIRTHSDAYSVFVKRIPRSQQSDKSRPWGIYRRYLPLERYERRTSSFRALRANPRTFERGTMLSFRGYDSKDYRAVVVRMKGGDVEIEYNVPGTGLVKTWVKHKDWAARLATMGNPSGRLPLEQERALAHKHMTGDFPGQKWSTIKALISKGMLREDGKHLLVTEKGRAYVDQYHTEISLSRPSRNPSETAGAEEMYETFHGRPAREIRELQEPEGGTRTLASLGDLKELVIKPVEGRKWVELDFTGDGIKLATNAKGSQLYILGGNQGLNGELEKFGSDTSKEKIELGEAVSIVYRARKSFTDFQASDWEHKFAEESGQRPIVGYDTATRRIFLLGGNYRVEAPGIIN